MRSYHFISKTIHWVTALIFIGLLGGGFYMTSLPDGTDKYAIYALHKSFGLLVLGLVFLRVFFHIFIKKPDHIKTHAPWERFLARAAHVFLYAALFMMPISGLIMSWAGDYPVVFFGYPLPDLIAGGKDLFNPSKETHEIFAFTALAVVGLHVAGAFKHHFIDKDETLQRMTTKRMGMVGGFVLLCAVGLLYAPAAFMGGKGILHELMEEEEVAAHEESSLVTSDNSVAPEGSIFLAPHWNIQKDESSIDFTLQQYGKDLQGRFSAFNGDIRFDPDALDQSGVTIMIDISSIDTGSDDRDKQAMSSDFFDIESFPHAVFDADTFEKVDDKNYIAHGHLTIRDVNLPIDLPFTLDIEEVEGKKRAGMRAALSMNRLDYGVGQGEWKKNDIVGENIDIQITLIAEQSE